jgi:hypothetical protein
MPWPLKGETSGRSAPLEAGDRTGFTSTVPKTHASSISHPNIEASKNRQGGIMWQAAHEGIGCDGCQSLRHVVGALLEKGKIRIDTFAAAALNPATLHLVVPNVCIAVLEESPMHQAPPCFYDDPKFACLLKFGIPPCAGKLESLNASPECSEYGWTEPVRCISNASPRGEFGRQYAIRSFWFRIRGIL